MGWFGKTDEELRMEREIANLRGEKAALQKQVNELTASDRKKVEELRLSADLIAELKSENAAQKRKIDEMTKSLQQQPIHYGEERIRMVEEKHSAVKAAVAEANAQSQTKLAEYVRRIAELENEIRELRKEFQASDLKHQAETLNVLKDHHKDLEARGKVRDDEQNALRVAYEEKNVAQVAQQTENVEKLRHAMDAAVLKEREERAKQDELHRQEKAAADDKVAQALKDKKEELDRIAGEMRQQAEALRLETAAAQEKHSHVIKELYEARNLSVQESRDLISEKEKEFRAQIIRVTENSLRENAELMKSQVENIRELHGQQMLFLIQLNAIEQAVHVQNDGATLDQLQRDLRELTEATKKEVHRAYEALLQQKTTNYEQPEDKRACAALLSSLSDLHSQLAKICIDFINALSKNNTLLPAFYAQNENAIKETKRILDNFGETVMDMKGKLAGNAVEIEDLGEFRRNFMLFVKAVEAMPPSTQRVLLNSIAYARAAITEAMKKTEKDME